MTPLVDSSDARFIAAVAARNAGTWSTWQDSLRSYAQRVNMCLYVPASYSHTGERSATGSLSHYGAHADLRDAIALEIF